MDNNKQTKQKIYIIGHKNPDTDSIASAIAYSDLKQRLGWDNVRPARAGIMNQQTSYILQKLNIKPPVIISDIRTRVCEVMIEEPIFIKYKDTLKTAFNLLDKNTIRFLPVVNDNNEPIGLLTLSITTMNFLKILEKKKLQLTAMSLKKTINGVIINDPNKDDSKEIEYEIIVGSCSNETFKQKLNKTKNIPKIVIIDDNYELINISAKSENVKIILLSKNCNIEKINRLKNLFYNTGKLVILCKAEIQDILLDVQQSILVKNIYTTDFKTILYNKPLDSALTLFNKEKLKGMVVVNDNNKIVGVITRSTFLNTNNHKQVILVDHNEPTQAIDGINEVEIAEIVDHHRISTFQTIKPITFINLPVGSTSTIVALQYKNYGIMPDKKIAQLLMAGILSDTVILNSPTTTQIDKNMIKWLNGIANINYKAFATGFFRAGSMINPKKLKETITSDFKEFDMNGNKVGIGQIEIVGFGEILKYKQKIIEYLKNIYDQGNYHFVGLLISDITEQSSIFVVITNEITKKQMPWQKLEPNIFELKGILSRKKQVVPALLRMYSGK